MVDVCGLQRKDCGLVCVRGGFRKVIYLELKTSTYFPRNFSWNCEHSQCRRSLYSTKAKEAPDQTANLSEFGEAKTDPTRVRIYSEVELRDFFSENETRWKLPEKVMKLLNILLIGLCLLEVTTALSELLPVLVAENLSEIVNFL